MVDPEDRKGSPRGFLHSILGWFILSIAFYIVGGELGIYFSIGYLSHIILDMLDESPFEIAYPFKADFRGFIRYNSWLEYLIILALIVILIRL